MIGCRCRRTPVVRFGHLPEAIAAKAERDRRWAEMTDWERRICGEPPSVFLGALGAPA